MTSNLKSDSQDWAGRDIQGENLIGGEFDKYIFNRAILNGADLSNSTFKGANFQKAEMRGVILTNALLYGANLSYADLSGADLRCSDLRGAILFGANLSNTKLSKVNLNGADVRNAILIQSHGLESEIINDLKQRGAIFENALNLHNLSNDEHKKWWLQFIVIPIVIALIGAGAAIINISSSINRMIPSSFIQQKLPSIKN
jgi:uncharacterized protein YjbI with pentapeptide repeats